MTVKSRGFASMDRKRVKELAIKGGKAAHENGKAHKWSKDEAKLAGLKGLAVRRENAKAKELAEVFKRQS